jgi:hypothetical protein
MLQHRTGRSFDCRCCCCRRRRVLLRMTGHRSHGELTTRSPPTTTYSFVQSNRADGRFARHNAMHSEWPRVIASCSGRQLGVLFCPDGHVLATMRRPTLRPTVRATNRQTNQPAKATNRQTNRQAKTSTKLTPKPKPRGLTKRSWLQWLSIRDHGCPINKRTHGTVKIGHNLGVVVLLAFPLRPE